MKNMSMKRFFSGLLMCVMLFNCLAVAAFAEEESGLCEHHAAHDELCGYAEAVEASPCTHEHGEDCAEVCSHSHDELCGYAEAVEAKPCGNIPCESCAALLMGDEEAAEEPIEEPVEEPIEEPVEEPVEEPAEEPVEEPVEEAVEGGEEEVTEEVPAIMSLSSDIGSGTPDSTPPELVSVSLSASTVTAPSDVEVIVEATDAVSGADWGYMSFYCESTGKDITISIDSTYYDTNSHEHKKYTDGKLHGTLKIDQYVESGTFVINHIELYDVADNYNHYHRNSNQYENQLPDSVMALQLKVRNTGADVTTSLANSSFIEEVENAGNSAYIVADYSGNSNMPQEAFDAIAGTDKTLELMSSGVTWRFEGEDIVNTSKDIDLNVDIVPVEQDSSSAGGDIQEELGKNPGVVMRFAENGQLPGKATIQVKLDYAMREYLGRSKGLCVYYHNNQTGQMELVAADVQVVDDSYVEFTIYHCSDYVLTRDPEIVQNRLDMSNVGADGGEIWVDGSRYSVQSSGGSSYLDLPDGNAKAMVSFSYHVGDANDVHTQYPIGMKVWALKLNEYGTYTASYVEELDNILQYSGSSIRIAGNKGIRMITSIENSKKAALTSGGLAGYKLLEYGTVLALASELEGGKPLILGEPYARSNYAYKRGVADPVFQYEGNLVQYTNVLVGFSLDQCKEDIAMRPYMILEDADGQQITIYGGTVYRSIGYIAWQNRKAFGSGSAAYEYVWEIIHHVYGDIYDEDYKA